LLSLLHPSLALLVVSGWPPRAHCALQWARRPVTAQDEQLDIAALARAFDQG
jgi:hypothetical protein